MWKLIVGFIVFAAVALYVISKAGDRIDMGGEKHGVEATTGPAGHASAPAAGAAPAASSASAAK
jgi:hypothetical protein